MRRRANTLLTLGLILAGGLCAGPVELRDDPPPFDPPKSGTVTGAIWPPGKVAGLAAVSRETRKTYEPTRWNAETGEFAFDELPGAAAYDVCFVAGGRRIEGIDLNFVNRRMLELAAERRRQLDLPPERDPPFTRDDADELLAYVRDLEEFADARRVLYLKGDGRRATMLVELLRTGAFYAEAGDEIIWRIELWYFAERFGGWERLANQERVLRRTRGPVSAWRKLSLEYYPQLSAWVDREGESEPVDFEIPDEPDASRGRVAGTNPKIETDPHVLGVEKRGDGPTTRPAEGADNAPGGDDSNGADGDG